jgi:SAM-dependent methyltransferase
MPDTVTRILRDAYDRRADDWDRQHSPVWEVEERDAFIDRLHEEHRVSVLELGAATGSDAMILGARGLRVVCIDLSPERIRRCRAKGLTATVMDVAELEFPPGSFDAAYAKNCLVHVPKARLRTVLLGIRRVLKPGGLFYLGVYGGRDFEGIWDGDAYNPKRFFSHSPDDDLRQIVSGVFQLCSFRRMGEGWNGLHYQSLVLRAAGAHERAT